MRTDPRVLAAVAAAGIACASQRPVIVADDWWRALAEARRAPDEVLLVELWAGW